MSVHAGLGESSSSSSSRVGSYVGSTRPLKAEARFITEAPLATVGVLRTPPLIIATERVEWSGKKRSEERGVEDVPRVFPARNSAGSLP